MFTKVRGALEGAENIKEGAEKIKEGASAPPSPILPTLMLTANSSLRLAQCQTIEGKRSNSNFFTPLLHPNYTAALSQARETKYFLK